GRTARAGHLAGDRVRRRNPLAGDEGSFMKERITTVDNESRFNPNDHMRVFERRQRQPDGSYKTVRVDYLDVKWRIVWFRQEHPNGSIVTELLSVPGEHPAVVRATVSYWD